MLSYLVAKWENVATVKYLWYTQNIYSNWYDWINLNNYKVVILQNSGTASASEIMIWTLKDYFKNITIIWENTYWKGSVQTVREYTDGSSLKYTVAKWFTWWSETWIDWVWIAPDIELELDVEAYQNGTDNQLQKAIDY
jgi:carboxyl-terminal processing protease